MKLAWYHRSVTRALFPLVTLALVASACSDSDDGGAGRTDAARVDAESSDARATPDASIDRPDARGVDAGRPDATSFPDAQTRRDAMVADASPPPTVVEVCEEACEIRVECEELEEGELENCRQDCSDFTGDNPRCQELAADAADCQADRQCNDLTCTRRVLLASLACLRAEPDPCACEERCGAVDRVGACQLDAQECADGPDSACCTTARRACDPLVVVPCNCAVCDIVQQPLCRIQGSQCINASDEDREVCCGPAEAFCIF